MVTINELDKRIKIIQKSKSSESVDFDEDGKPIGQVEKEIVVRECWASFRRTTGTEAVKANADFNTLRCRFVVRTTNVTITNKMYIQYNGQEYNIIYVNDYNDSKEFTEIWCEVVSNGI